MLSLPNSTANGLPPQSNFARQVVDAHGMVPLPVLVWSDEELHAVGGHDARLKHLIVGVAVSGDAEDVRLLRARIATGEARLWLVPNGQQSPTPSTTATLLRGGLTGGALRRVREHVRTRLAEKIELAELAKLVGLSVCHFSRAFKQSMGMPPYRYLMQERVTAAAQLLRATDRPLAEISLEAGFSDQSHFTRCFSDVMGETPRNFRRRHR